MSKQATITTAAAAAAATSDGRRAEFWRSRLVMALRSVMACAIIGSITLYGPPRVQRQLGFPAFSYATCVLIVTADATLGDAMRGCWCTICATAQGALPGVLCLWVIKPVRLTTSTTALAVGVSAFVVALPNKSTPLMSKRIALGQIVLVYVVAFINQRSADIDVVMHPFHVAASTAVGAFAAVLALLFPYPRLACYKIKRKCSLFAEIASERLSLLVLALCSQDDTSALASLSQAQFLSSKGAKLLQGVQLKQESMQWETSRNRFLQPNHNHYYSRERLQSLEIPLRGMEIALTSSCPSVLSVRLVDSELKSFLQRLEEQTTMALRRHANLPSECSSTVPPAETIKKEVDTSPHTLKTIFPTYENLPSFFFLFCVTVLHQESVTNQSEKQATQAKEEANSHEQDCFSRLLSGVPMKMSSERFMFALKCSISMGLSVLFGLTFSKENGYWAGLAVGLGMSSAGEATFKVANLRAQGTVLGSIYGVLGCFLLQRFMAIRFLSLLPWIIFTSFLTHSQMYGQVGGISAVVAALLILGRKNYGAPGEFAFARITETFIGLICYVLVELLLQPTRAATLAKIQLSQSIRTLYECIESMSLAASHENNSISELKEKQERLGIQVSELQKFIAEAEAEPNFWFLPFNGICYSNLLGSLSKMMELLVLGGRAIDLFLSESKRFGVSWKGLVGQTDGDVEAFKKMVCSSIICCEEVTTLKSLAALENELIKKQNSCDIEVGKSPTPNVDQFKLLSTNQDEIESILTSYLQNTKEALEKIHSVTDDQEELKSQMVLCLTALGFCMGELMKETTKIAMGVKELVQWENPSSHVNLYEIYCKIQSTRNVL